MKLSFVGILGVIGAACGSSGTHVKDGSAGGLAAAEDYYAAFFTEGSKARYRVVEERSSVTPEAAERGGPEGPGDWVEETQEGELTCTVARVQTLGDMRVGTIVCEGFQFAQLSAPLSGTWIETTQGLYHAYRDEFTEAEARDFINTAQPNLERPVRLGKRGDEEVEYLTDRDGQSVCVTDQYLVGDDGGTRICFVPNQWPEDLEASGGAAWMTTTVKLTRP